MLKNAIKVLICNSNTPALFTTHYETPKIVFIERGIKQNMLVSIIYTLGFEENVKISYLNGG